MKNMENFSPLNIAPLFQGVNENDIADMVKCLGARAKQFKKNETIFSVGDFVSEIGIITEGRVQISKDDVWGNRNIIAEVSEGEMFAEAFVCGGVGVLPVCVAAATDCKIIFVDFQRVITQCGKACVFHSLLIRNIVGILARKNIMLQGKMEHITKRTTREKLLSYLSEQSQRLSTNDFEIPFDRQRLADYLSVERSALSAEMSRLKSEGVIDYHKSNFKLLIV